MDDQAIIDLYWARAEQAVAETEKKYGTYCRSIAWNILRNHQDSEECVNDTWMRTWNSLPPHRPSVFPVYLGTITRNLSLTLLRSSSTKKRSPRGLELSYEELEEGVPGGFSVETQVDARELGSCIDRFLRTIPEKDRCMFLRRYWYMDTHREIAHRYHMTEGSVKAKLHKIRNRLRVYLEQEGFAG